MGSDVNVPEEAVKAAYEATGGSPLIRTILAAGAPAIRSQERQRIRDRLQSSAAGAAASLALSKSLPPDMRFDTSKDAPFADREGIALRIVAAAFAAVENSHA